MFYPPVPTFDGAMAGGVVATNAAGAATFKYGSTRQWVRGLTVVLSDGSVLDLRRGEVCAHADGHIDVVNTMGQQRIALPTYRMPKVPKCSAGYFAEPEMDLIDLFIGSEGTLGVITTVTFALITPRPTTCLLWLPLSDERAALDLVTTFREEAQATWRTRDERGVDVAAVEHLDHRSPGDHQRGRRRPDTRRQDSGRHGRRAAHPARAASRLRTHDVGCLRPDRRSHGL